MQCEGFYDLLLARNISQLDLLSIDIEGLEAKVLQCLPFDKIDIYAILIETNQHAMRELDLFMARHDYSNRETFVNSVHADGFSRSYWFFSLPLSSLFLTCYYIHSFSSIF
jgi:hypothetical protein